MYPKRDIRFLFSTCKDTIFHLIFPDSVRNYSRIYIPICVILGHYYDTYYDIIEIYYDIFLNGDVVRNVSTTN